MLARLLRASLITLGMTGATASGCAPDLPLQPAPPPPSLLAPPPQLAAAAPQPAPAAQLPADMIDLARTPLLLEDPRLAAVKVEVDREAYARAAQAMTAAMSAAAPDDRPAWLYQLGRLRALGGDPTGAAKAFEESASLGYVLADHARLQAAQWLVGAGQHDAAIAAARAVTVESLAGPIDLVMADAHLGKRDFPGAAKHFRAYLGRDKKPPSWVSVTLRFANALLQHPSEAHAEEAVKLARRVLWEGTGDGAGEAADIEKKALDTLPSGRREKIEKLSSDEQLAKARGLMSTGQARAAVIATDRLLKLPRAKAPSEFACELWMVRAEALVKMKNKKPEAATAYKGAIEHCEGQPRRAEALFAGGRASASAGLHPEAAERFALLEKEHPQHRLSDDARLRGARAVLEANDEPRYEAMLARIADDYPEGDVVNDGLFELAIHHIEKRNWQRAIGPLEKALARTPRERMYWASGRLPYYLARAHAELGAAEQAKAEFAAVIRDYPLSFYMALAHARLAAADRAAADRALAEAASRESEPAGSFPVQRGAWQTQPVVQRGLELLRQGDIKLAKAELGMERGGAQLRALPREAQYAAAFLFARSEDLKDAHGILRNATLVAKPLPTDLLDYLEHYPAGRWRAAWEVAYPRPFVSIVSGAARQQGIPEALAYAIMREESAFDPRVVSAAKAYGLMQLIVPTAKKMGGSMGISPDEESLKQPSVNIPLGCRYLSVLRNQFPDNPLLAIPGYNAGGGAPKKWIAERGADDFDLWVERIPYEETRNYTKRVIGTMAAYEALYGGPGEALRAPLAASPAMRGGAVAQP